MSSQSYTVILSNRNDSTAGVYVPCQEFRLAEKRIRRVVFSFEPTSQHQKNSRGEKLYPFYVVRIFEKDDHQMKKAAFSNVFV